MLKCIKEIKFVVEYYSPFKGIVDYLSRLISVADPEILFTGGTLNNEDFDQATQILVLNIINTNSQSYQQKYLIFIIQTFYILTTNTTQKQNIFIILIFII